MPAFPDPFSDRLIDAELPWPACDLEPERGPVADDAYWQSLAEKGAEIGASSWCAIDKHQACKGRRFDANFKPHACQCGCHREAA